MVRLTLLGAVGPWEVWKHDWLPAAYLVVTGVRLGPRLYKTGGRRRMGRWEGRLYLAMSFQTQLCFLSIQHTPASVWELFFVLLISGTLDEDKTWQIGLAYRPNVDVCRQLWAMYFLLQLDGVCKRFQFKNIEMEYTLTINSVSDCSKSSPKDRHWG